MLTSPQSSVDTNSDLSSEAVTPLIWVPSSEAGLIPWTSQPSLRVVVAHSLSLVEVSPEASGVLSGMLK